MQSPMEVPAMTVEPRHNTSKSSFEPSRSGNKLRTCFRFVSTFHCRSPSMWKQSGYMFQLPDTRCTWEEIT